MFTSKKVKLSLALVAVLVSIGLLYVCNSYSKMSNQNFTVTLTDSGYQPSEITIHKGDTVTFKTARPYPFWPASDSHPSHSKYPSFDPKKSLNQNDTWQFTFEEVGTWRYHDHLNATLRGVIYVLEE